MKKSNYNVVNELIQMKFPLDYTKNNGITAVGIAAFKGNIQMLDLLVNAGASLS